MCRIPELHSRLPSGLRVGDWFQKEKFIASECSEFPNRVLEEAPEIDGYGLRRAFRKEVVFRRKPRNEGLIPIANLSASLFQCY